MLRTKQSDEQDILHGYFESLEIERISAVFCIPHLEFTNKYTVKYTASFHYSSKLYYIKSHGLDFHITPFSLFKHHKLSSVYTVGAGLYKNRLHTIVLVEIFDEYEILHAIQSKICNFFIKKLPNHNLLRSISNTYIVLSYFHLFFQTCALASIFL